MCIFLESDSKAFYHIPSSKSPGNSGTCEFSERRRRLLGGPSVMQQEAAGPNTLDAAGPELGSP